MFKLAKYAALSALIGLGALAAAPSSAQASSGSLHLSSGSGVAVSFHFGDRRGHGYRNHGRYDRRASCTPREAAQKAQRMGLRNVRIVGENHRTIRVAGYAPRYGRTAISFARAPHCPVVR